MKKFFFMGIGMALTIFVFYSCDLLKSLQKVEQSGFICSIYPDDQINEMDKDKVVKMVRNYHENQYKILHENKCNVLDLPNPNIKDSRAVFFSVDILKKLIYFIEKGSKNFSSTDKQNLGLNIYFASYPSNFNIVKHNYDYKNRHTLIFVPSVFNGTIAKDFDLKSDLLNTPNTPSYILEPFFSSGGTMVVGTDQSLLKIMNNNSNNMTSQNDGTGTPPPPGNINPLLALTGQ